jgi:hypothetical protein
MPDSEVATLECYFREYLVYSTDCTFAAVDGLRTSLSQMQTKTAKVPPGSHWIQVEFESYFGGGRGGNDCGFDIELQPGHVYQIMSGSLHLETSWYRARKGFDKGSIEVRVRSSSGMQEDRHVEVTCGVDGGAMCRKDEDCLPHSDMKCIPQEGFPFGQCRFKD